jgi:hypothetical protein
MPDTKQEKFAKELEKAMTEPTYTLKLNQQKGNLGVCYHHKGNKYCTTVGKNRLGTEAEIKCVIL